MQKVVHDRETHRTVATTCIHAAFHSLSEVETPLTWIPTTTLSYRLIRAF